jgi:hypothetical protein
VFEVQVPCCTQQQLVFGSGFWFWLLVLAFGSGFWLRFGRLALVLALVVGFGFWLRFLALVLALVFGFGCWLRFLALVVGFGLGVWFLDLVFGSTAAQRSSHTAVEVLHASFFVLRRHDG